MFDADCIPCILKQAIRTYRILGYEEDKIIDRVKKINSYYTRLDWSLSAPEIYFKVFKWITEDTRVADPYEKVKEYWNKYVMKHYRKLKTKIERAKDPLYQALKIALAGNIIDFGALEKFDFKDTLEKILSKKLAIDDYRLFVDKMDDGDKIVYFLDNAGEAVLDKLFLETLMEKYDLSKIYLGVREAPFINDVTYDDIEKLGFNDLGDIEIIKLPVSLEKHLAYVEDGRYREIFNYGDVTILKGQGNYELFYMYKDIFFLLMVKCRPVANMLGVEIGSGVFKYSK